MSGVTLKILHGADRGKVYEDLQPPLTVGREEGNDIQLNDERVSRCHFKVQRDNERLVLTDLDSTNGTKVNGTECQLKILRHGDLIALGRSLILVGSEEQIAARLAAMGSDNPTLSRDMSSAESSIALELNQESKSPYPSELIQIVDTPSIPDGLSPGQKAQLCEILDYLQARLHKLIETAKTNEGSDEVVLSFSAWQRLLDAQSRLSAMGRKIADPDWPN
ncbi:FHA domain-containing protein FhaA [Novipirellula galeiformis]|uniref:FHA domain-containing protein FhaA n=1 Tax=Novipirellula galeiformis TaxID=2528004 RepID=A0A5C6CVU9_9BACT|nr:FHA domain-containing protein [Novipirellula galeiformis]TWU26849.1 FHA domain-containing protein FhaA [Novipirellula galeiformis]